jgi:hypothetical protein
MKARKKIIWTITSYAAGALATMLTRRLLVLSWKSARHEPPPDDPADRGTPWTPAIVWAISSGVGIGVARLVAVRGAAKAWEATTNEPHP